MKIGLNLYSVTWKINRKHYALCTKFLVSALNCFFIAQNTIKGTQNFDQHKNIQQTGMYVGLRPNVRFWDLNLQGECPPWAFIKGTLDRIYASFGENNGKLRTARPTSATECWSWCLSSSRFEGKTTQPLMGRYECMENHHNIFRGSRKKKHMCS